MKNLFKDLQHVQFEGKNSTNPLSYHYYNSSQVIRDKTIEAHLKIAISFWHSVGMETLYEPTWHYIVEPMQLAETRMHAFFEFVEKLGLRYFTFLDSDLAPEGKTMRETQKNFQLLIDQVTTILQHSTIKLLWGAANVFNHERYKEGAITHTNPDVFAYALRQIKKALEVTHQLGGENYLIWLGNENGNSYESLARFLLMLVEYKNKIGFEGTLLIQPKSRDFAKHPYDCDVATLYALLQKNKIDKEFKFNMPAVTTTSMYEFNYACSQQLLGGIDIDQNQLQLLLDSHDTAMQYNQIVQMFYMMLRNNSMTTGGINVDTKMNKNPMDQVDLYCAYVYAMDVLAQGLLIANDLISSEEIEKVRS